MTEEEIRERFERLRQRIGGDWAVRVTRDNQVRVRREDTVELIRTRASQNYEQ